MIIDIDTTGAREALRVLLDDLRLAAKQAVSEAVESAKKQVQEDSSFQDRTFQTRRSISSSTWNYQGQVRAGGAMEFLENGTRPHPIEAVNASMLRFVSNGEVMFRKSVNHPGTDPLKVMARAGDTGEVALESGMEKHAQEAITKYNS